MAFLAAAAPFVAAAGSLVQGVGGFMSGNHNAAVLKDQAGDELAASNERERMARDDARRTIGAQIAAQWSNGLEGGSGTALDALRESELNAAMDAAAIRREGIGRAKALREKAKSEKRQGAFALAGGLLGAASSVGSMKHDWAQARTGSTPAGGG